MNNLFLTGPVGIGKSTILQNILKEINLSIGGYITSRVYEEHYMKFVAKSLIDDLEHYTIIEVDTKKNLMKVFKESFETGLIQILDKSIKHTDLIVLDELGTAENDIDIFTSKVFEILDSEKIVLGVLKYSNCDFLSNIRKRNDVIIIRITEENRDHILEKVLDIIKGFIN